MDDDDKRMNWHKGENGERIPGQPSVKTEMIFVGIEEQETKKKTEDLAGQWTAMLKSGAVDVQLYVVENHQVWHVVFYFAAGV